MLWVQNSGRPEFFEDFAFAGAKPFMKRYICSDHFSPTDFIDPKDRLSGLLPTAVPNLTLHKFEPKEEHDDDDYAEPFDDNPLSDSEVILNDVKVGRFEIDNGGNSSFSSTEDSSTDLLCGNSTDSVNVYKETEQDKQVSETFFKNYNTAVIRTRSNRRANETEQERAERLRRQAMKAKIKRSNESEEQKKVRRMRNALRAALVRKNETPEQKELRKKKDVLRAQRRRKAETESEANLRRYNDAVRAAFRRNNETKQQRMVRKQKDVERAAKRRGKETPEERETRLRKDRERASRRRMYKKMVDQVLHLSLKPEFAHLLIPIKMERMENGTRRVSLTSLQSVAGQCQDPEQEPSFEKLQQVLAFVHGRVNPGVNGGRKSSQRTRTLKKVNYSEDDDVDVLCTAYGDGRVQSVGSDKCEPVEEGDKKLGCLKETKDESGASCVVTSENSDGCDGEGIVDFLEPEVVWG